MSEHLPIDRGNGIYQDFPVPGEAFQQLIDAIPHLDERFESRGIKPKTAELFEAEIIEKVRAFCEVNRAHVRTLLCIADDQLQIIFGMGLQCLESDVMDEITRLDIEISDLGWYADCMAAPRESIEDMRDFATFAAAHARSDD